MDDWSGLGFNPAPGNVGSVRDTAHQTRAFANSLRTDADTLSSVGRGVDWVGEAADAFRRNVAQLPQDLHACAQSFGDTAVALLDYASDLEAAQRRAVELEREALAVREALLGAQQSVAYAPPADPTLPQLQTQTDDLSTRLRELRGLAEDVEEQVRQAGQRAATQVRDAARHAPDEPGILENLGNKLAGFVREHAEAIANLSKVLKVIGAAAGVASLFLFWVPGLGQGLAAISLASNLAATGLDAALYASGATDPTTGKPYVSGTDLLKGAAISATSFVGGTAASGFARAASGGARARAAGVASRVDTRAVLRREFRQSVQFLNPTRTRASMTRWKNDFATFRSSVGSSSAPTRSWFAPNMTGAAAEAYTYAGYHINAAQTVYDNAQLFGQPRTPALRPAAPAR